MNEAPIRNLWDRLPFFARLLVTASVALAVSAALMLVASIRQDARYVDQSLRSRLQTEIHSLTLQAADLAVTGDFATLQQVMDIAVQGDMVAGIRYRDSTGALLESKDTAAPRDAPDWFARWLTIGEYRISGSIEIGGRNYGEMEVILTPWPEINRAWFRVVQQFLILLFAIAMDFIGIWLVLHFGLKPLSALDTGSRSLAKGHFEQAIPVEGSPEFRHVIQAFNGMAAEVGKTLGALAESEGRLSAILHSIGDGLIATDSTMRVTFLNPIAESLTGWSHQEAAGRTVSDVFRIENARSGRPAEIPVGRVIETGQVIGLANHTVLIARDGRRYHIADSAAPVRDAKGVLVGVVMVFRDITESYRLRSALEENRTRLSLALKGADLGLLDWNLQNNEVVFDERWAAMLGYRLDEISPTSSSYEMLAHPEDLPRVMQALSEHIAGHTPQFEVELRMKAKSGEWCWVLMRGRVTERDIHGKPLRFTGTHIDISERKKSEEALQLAAIAFETTEALFITDLNGIILRVNQAFATITGFSAEEAVGRRPGDLLRSGRHDVSFYAGFWRRLQEEGRWEGEIWNRRRNGDIFPEWLSIRSARDSRGAITHYIANFTDLTERKEAQEEIERLAYYDSLTGLPNRRLFLDRVAQELLSSRRVGHCGAVLYLDVDHFKHLNDARGHQVGDTLLKQAARRLVRALREGDTVARLGGDEFVVLLCNLAPALTTAAAQARVVAGKLREALCRVYNLEGGEYYLGVSMGVTLFPEDHETADELLRRADTAMYRVKESGRGSVCFYEPQMQEAVEARLTLERDLREALVKNEFRIYLQGQYDGAGHLAGVEALLRWEHPTRGIILPASFVPVAEESNLIVPIGDWVLAAAARVLKQFEDAGHNHLRISVNVSPRQFHEKDFVHRVREMLAAVGASPHQLTFEITEGMLLADIGESIARMAELEHLGVRFSIDDFGTGYSSLAYLKRLPLRELKIDRGFVASLPRDADDAALVDTILAIARQMRLVVVAEGLENTDQLEYLKERGCDFFQGYHFGRPIPADDFLPRLDGRRGG